MLLNAKQRVNVKIVTNTLVNRAVPKILPYDRAGRTIIFLPQS